MDYTVSFTIKDYPNWKTNLKDALGDGFCTILNIFQICQQEQERQQESVRVGHSIIIAYYNGELIAIDIQQEEIYNFDYYSEHIYKDIDVFVLTYRGYSNKRIIDTLKVSRADVPTNPNRSYKRIKIQ